MRRLVVTGTLLLMASNSLAQSIAPTRTFGRDPVGVTPTTPIMPARPQATTSIMQGMTPPPKPQFGYHETTIAPILPPPIVRTQRASSADTTTAEPLTLSDPGHGMMTDFYDPSPNAPAQSLPGQKREIMRDR